MSRTTSDAIGNIVEVESGISLSPFIEVANSLVTSECTGGSLDSTRLELIERWLAAFFYAIRDKRRTREQADVVSENYQHVEDLGFDANEYGQMAMRLDTTGGLAQLNEATKNGKGTITPVINWGGTANPNAIAVDL